MSVQTLHHLESGMYPYAAVIVLSHTTSGGIIFNDTFQQLSGERFNIFHYSRTLSENLELPDTAVCIMFSANLMGYSISTVLSAPTHGRRRDKAI